MTKRFMRNTVSLLTGLALGTLLALGLARAEEYKTFHLYGTGGKVLDQVKVSPAFDQLVADELLIEWIPIIVSALPEGCEMTGAILVVGYPIGTYQYNMIIYITPDGGSDILALNRINRLSSTVLIVWYGGEEDGVIVDEATLGAELEKYFPTGHGI